MEVCPTSGAKASLHMASGSLPSPCHGKSDLFCDGKPALNWKWKVCSIWRRKACPYLASEKAWPHLQTEIAALMTMEAWPTWRPKPAPAWWGKPGPSSDKKLFFWRRKACLAPNVESLPHLTTESRCHLKMENLAIMSTESLIWLPGAEKLGPPDDESLAHLAMENLTFLATERPYPPGGKKLDPPGDNVPRGESHVDVRWHHDAEPGRLVGHGVCVHLATEEIYRLQGQSVRVQCMYVDEGLGMNYIWFGSHFERICIPYHGPHIWLFLLMKTNLCFCLMENLTIYCNIFFYWITL